ncbi:arginine-tRNA-protein transferase 1 [Aulographum hederae CBS 113979]|uniref:Arginyl-tRNA--protein transferase 1 n=1 Tax=Aulographum hederae CBS 113979 TaxID=1176131 RepID=A0A6G1H7P7_9PEZI|nr:arginine-tRNA-protein transferase 1 [Aulographum hederae CBS 113979]
MSCRSGTLLYLPDNLRSCCPHYTIRLPADKLKPSHHQRKASNRWNKYVLGDTYIKEAAKKYPKSRAEKRNNEFNLATSVHEAEYSSLKGRTPPEPEHRFEVNLEPDTFSEEKYKLFENYQAHVHNEPPPHTTPAGFKRFLCSSPLTRHDSPDKPLGSYHQCYRLDGRLIAMGVLDLLPHCVSGVYFIYQQDFEKWTFGKLSALREAELALTRGYQYYYMGYYIHSCKKMKYKNEYRPQYMLDLRSFQWDPLDDSLLALLDQKKFVSMSEERKLAENGRPDTEMTDVIEVSSEDTAGVAQPIDEGTSLFDVSFPGVMSLEDLERTVDLDECRVRVQNLIVKTKDLMAWESGDATDPQSLKGIIAEMMACVGPEVAREAVVRFGK